MVDLKAKHRSDHKSDIYDCNQNGDGNKLVIW